MHEENNQHKQQSDVAFQDLLEKLGRDDKALASLAGYFDVLIQMDFAAKRRKERKSDEEKRKEKD